MQTPSIYRSVGPEKSLAEKVIDELERLILTGKLKEGEKLPSERELSVSFEVSRTVVREAIRVLQTRGLLQVRPGIGSIVRRPTANQVVAGLSQLIRAKANGIEVSLASLHEVRTLLETDIIRLAAQRANVEDIEELQRAITDLEALVKFPVKFLEQAIDFHRTLALATHNPLLVVLFDSIQEIMYGMRQTLVPEPITPSRALKTFRQILRHIQEGEPEEAAEAIQKHLFEVWQEFERALSKLEIESDELIIEA